MDSAKQVEIIEELLGHVDSGTTTCADAVRRNEASFYTSPKILRREKERLFFARPLVAGLSGDLPREGSFVAEEILGVPVVLVRGEDRRIRAFLNSCHHRNEPALHHAHRTFRALLGVGLLE